MVKQLSPKKALFAGSFDPPSNGHLDIIERASNLVDLLIVGVGENFRKPKRALNLIEKVGLLKKMTSHLLNVEVLPFQGLVSKFAKDQGINFLIRGLRNISDVNIELQMAIVNEKIGEIETLFLMANPKYQHISSTLIYEMASFGQHLHDLVPQVIEKDVFELLSKIT